jgi:primase-polymerase (primpol)-like protein
MQSLPEALRPLAAYKQFILWKAVPSKRKPGKFDKLPVDPRTLQVYAKGIDWQQDPNATTDFDTAAQLQQMCGEAYGVGYLFTEKDPFFFLDIDNCLEGSEWSALAQELMRQLPGAAIEVSQSGTGLHIFGKALPPEHSSKNEPLGIELYTERRFVALTGTNAVGSADIDFTNNLAYVAANYFPPKTTAKSQEWTSEPVAEYTGPEDDNELLEKALASQSSAATFGDVCTFRQLWEADEEAMAKAYPDGDRTYNASQADAALAQHLAFWTGNNCDRILRLFWLSGLVRDKWQREDYLYRTILNAVSMQESVYSIPAEGAEVVDPIAEQFNAPRFRGSPKQTQWAGSIRAQKLQACLGDEELIVKLCAGFGPLAKPSFWIDNQHLSPEEIAAAAAPIEKALEPLSNAEPMVMQGYQYLGVSQQMEHFRGCVYIQDLHRIFTPYGS